LALLGVALPKPRLPIVCVNAPSTLWNGRPFAAATGRFLPRFRRLGARVRDNWLARLRR